MEMVTLSRTMHLPTILDRSQIGFRNINQIPWSAQFPDLNQMDHLWDEVERSLRSLEKSPSNLTQLRVAIMSAWTRNGYAVRMKETYETLKHMLSCIEYSKHSWHICADLKVIAVLVGLQAGYTKFCCFLCQWDSSDREKHYVKKV
ncbi:hypothetical protein AVEN_118090-1 [Araneus ventricosus]|uniref:Uncharacterized protein n=1 Tax=Araneus ventricosus TaxID=182803 RepID=A0A4Y2MXF4_ARAVE|nr:hypothetical protein AVEN_118090-1 [Araneus ventricosus]